MKNVLRWPRSIPQNFFKKKTLAAETNAYPWRSLGGKFDEAYYKCDSSDYICLYINEMDNQQWYKEQERELGLFCYYKILTISKKKKKLRYSHDPWSYHLVSPLIQKGTWINCKYIRPAAGQRPKKNKKVYNQHT